MSPDGKWLLTAQQESLILLPTGAGVPKNYPRLAGQYAEYTYSQLKAFRDGERGSDTAGKDSNGKIMATISARMSDPQMRALAEYTSGLR